MHHHHLKHWVALWGLLALVSGCASAPSRFYTLSAESAATPSSSNLSVVVGPVSVPASVDRPEIVVSTGPNQLRLEEFDRWASPLQDEIARAVAENLIGILHTPHVTLASQDLGAGARYRRYHRCPEARIDAGGGRRAGCRLERTQNEGQKDDNGRERLCGRPCASRAMRPSWLRTAARLPASAATSQNAIRSLDRGAS